MTRQMAAAHKASAGSSQIKISHQSISLLDEREDALGRLQSCGLYHAIIGGLAFLQIRAPSFPHNAGSPFVLRSFFV